MICFVMIYLVFSAYPTNEPTESYYLLFVMNPAHKRLYIYVVDVRAVDAIVYYVMKVPFSEIQDFTPFRESYESTVFSGFRTTRR